MLEALASFDLLAGRLAQEVRAAPLTTFFSLVSAWWVNGLLVVGIGAAAALCRRRVPMGAVCAAAAYGVAALVVTAAKDAADRARPPLAHAGELLAVTALPADASFPSGHTAAAFATATAVAAFHPRLRVPLLLLAALVGVSRVYLGVHFVLDVVAGAALGAAIGMTLALGLRRTAAALRPTALRA